MRVPGNLALLAVGMLLAGLEVGACTLDLQGMPGGSSATSGVGGATASSSASGTAVGGGESEGSTGATGTGGRSSSPPVCGDGKTEGDEQCDDGNLVLGDGCSATCTIDPLDTCGGLPFSLTPAGLTLTGTLEGAKNDLTPSCSNSRADVVYQVKPTTSGTLKLTLTGAHDKSLSVRSSCPDGPNAELSCATGQDVLVVRRWVYANVTYAVLLDGASDAFSLQLDLTSCGDGVQQELEECDDPHDATCVGCFKCKGPDEVADPASRHCYRRIAGQGKEREWSGARASCLAWNGDLVGISSAAEADFLKTKFNDMWSGANDIADECSFNWVNGEPWQPHWAGNEPNDSNKNEDCAIFYSSGQMNDTSCSDQRDALCERAPGGSCGDGIVQPGEECDDKIAYAHLTCSKCVIACPAGESKDAATHHCYRVVTGAGSTWDAARDDCAASGAYLTTINSPTENQMLFQMNLNGAKWIGASRSDKNADFKWLNTDAVCYTNWSPTPPKDDKHCGTLLPSGTWVNETCSQLQGYICERDN
jgi:cysteine-rich repeat protein